MNQAPPHGDRRHRVHASIKFYVAELMVGTSGATWNFQNSAERVIYRYPDGSMRVQFRTRFIPVLCADEMSVVVNRHLSLGTGPVLIEGRYIYPEDRDNEFEAFPFVDSTSLIDHQRFQKICPPHKAPESTPNRWFR